MRLPISNLRVAGRQLAKRYSRGHGSATCLGCAAAPMGYWWTQRNLDRLRYRDGAARYCSRASGLRFIAGLMLALFLLPAALAQDATQTAPQAYQLQLENEWVRVIRVHYEPRAKIPPHAHTQWPCAYVYLNDGGPVIFRHKDWDHPELTRPATKAGSFRLSPTTAVNEVHEVENPNDTPSDFLRVEFKTAPLGRKSLRGRFYREAYPAGANFRKVEFENEQLRVTRLVCHARQSVDVAASRTEPALLIILSAARLRFNKTPNATTPTMLELGKDIWLGIGQQEQLENLGDTPLELLRFDLRTAPVKAPERQSKSGK